MNGNFMLEIEKDAKLESKGVDKSSELKRSDLLNSLKDLEINENEEDSQIVESEPAPIPSFILKKPKSKSPINVKAKEMPIRTLPVMQKIILEEVKQESIEQEENKQEIDVVVPNLEEDIVDTKEEIELKMEVENSQDQAENIPVPVASLDTFDLLESLKQLTIDSVTSPSD